ncbi:hypothetical protein JOC77_004239 [Peribacillus deserti]|uniref:DUF4871 domain-containing protein n=1 Tax=Peribacillus deserti TaxID=673318 RepID=A0ABS2QNL5_9BACI|nr:hypothetical protein [Peribacillus deserti]MBM7694762.1 hypothetical protein [Peribacillus deserti]
MCKKVVTWIVTAVLLLGLAACSNEAETAPAKDEKSKVQSPIDTPEFVKNKDIDKIEWDKPAVTFMTNTNSEMLGIPNKLGVLGPGLKKGEIQKLMWHFWGKERGEMTVVGYHRKSSAVHPVLWDVDTKSSYWKAGRISGQNNGADAHMPSNVLLHESGTWAFLVYLDDQLFDTLVLEVGGNGLTSKKEEYPLTPTFKTEGEVLRGLEGRIGINNSPGIQ